MSEKTLTASGTLSVGIQFEGAWHRDFVLRLPTVGDELDATDADVPDAGYGVALMAACLVSLGSVPPEAITYELLRGLLSEDYAQLTQARDDLKKKLRPESDNTVTSGTPASDSGATATPTKTSVR